MTNYIFNEQHYGLPVKFFDENGNIIRRVTEVNFLTGEVETFAFTEDDHPILNDDGESILRVKKRHPKITMVLEYK